MEASLLINLDSRRAKSDYRELMIACRDAGVNIVKEYQVGRKSSLSATLGAIKRAAPSLLIIAAGDGTLSRAMSLLAGTKIEIGIIPLGTTNNFARSLNIPLNLTDAIKLMLKNNAQPVDSGVVGSRHFANVVGIGMSAKVARRVSDKQKQRHGRLAYTAAGLKSLISHKPFFVTVTDKDSELAMHFETHQVIIANGRYHAGREIAVDARANSKELIVFPIGGRNKLDFIIRMIDFYIGKRKEVRHASYLIARNIKIHTDRPQPCEVDGEVYRPTPLSFRVASGVVNVRYRGRA